jgi:hypothetical protein
MNTQKPALEGGTPADVSTTQGAQKSRIGKGALVSLALVALAAPFFIYSIATRPTFVPVPKAPLPPLFPGHPIASSVAGFVIDLLTWL